MKENWDQSVGALYDGGPCPNESTGKCAVHAQDGNGLAILSGATNNSVAAGLVSNTTPEASILGFLSRALARPYGNAFYDKSTLSPDDQFDQRVYAFISYFELAARFQTGQNQNQNFTTTAASAFEELRRLYGHMATHDPFSTFWEGIGPNGSYYEQGFTSLAHGWSTGIVPLFQNYVLGVAPTGAGFATFDVKPVVVGGGLTFARGVVPTPNGGGGISVDWTVEDATSGAGLVLTVVSPAGSTGTVYVPVAAGEGVVTRDGATVWTTTGGPVQGVGFGGGYVVVGVEAGSTHVFATASGDGADADADGRVSAASSGHPGHPSCYTEIGWLSKC